jgi:hypothetical protein
LQLRLEALGAVVICSVALIVVWQRTAAQANGSEGINAARNRNGVLGSQNKGCELDYFADFLFYFLFV